eukprot:92586-Pelagomonas_calceolata.AAC.1
MGARRSKNNLGNLPPAHAKNLKPSKTSSISSYPQRTYNSPIQRDKNSINQTQHLETEIRHRTLQHNYSLIPCVTPTNLQTDIVPTGTCGFWIQKIDIVKYNPKPPLKQTPTETATHTPLPTPPPTLTLSEIYKSRVACIYNMDIKCIGMMTPDSFDVLYRAFHKARALGLHSSICPPPASFASGLMEFQARKTKLRTSQFVEQM